MIAAPTFYSEAKGGEYIVDCGDVNPDDSSISLTVESVWGVELLTGRMGGVPDEVECAHYPNLVALTETLSGHNDADGIVQVELIPGSDLIDQLGQVKGVLANSALNPWQELKGTPHV